MTHSDRPQDDMQALTWYRNHSMLKAGYNMGAILTLYARKTIG